MKVKCIRQRTKKYLNGRSWERHVTGLTIDKIYEVLDTAHIADEPVYYIMKDSGFTDWILTCYFITTEELRHNKLEELGI